MHARLHKSGNEPKLTELAPRNEHLDWLRTGRAQLKPKILMNTNDTTGLTRLSQVHATDSHVICASQGSSKQTCAKKATECQEYQSMCDDEQTIHAKLQVSSSRTSSSAANLWNGICWLCWRICTDGAHSSTRKRQIVSPKAAASPDFFSIQPPEVNRWKM